MKRLVSDCCLKLGLIPGHELEKTLKITLDQFMLSEKRRGLRDAQVDQTSADHKVAVQQFLDEYGDRFWPQAQAECGGLLHYAPVFPRDQQVISNMISHLLANKLGAFAKNTKYGERSRHRPNSDLEDDKEATRGPLVDADDDSQKTKNKCHGEDFEDCVEPNHDAELDGSNKGGRDHSVIDSIEQQTVDNGELRAADADKQRQSNELWGTGLYEDDEGRFGARHLTARMIDRTMLWINTSEHSYAKKTYLSTSMTPETFLETIAELWNLGDSIYKIETVTYKLEWAPWPVLMSDNYVRGHEAMMGEIEAWWERFGKGDDRCMVAISIKV